MDSLLVTFRVHMLSPQNGLNGIHCSLIPLTTNDSSVADSVSERLSVHIALSLLTQDLYIGELVLRIASNHTIIKVDNCLLPGRTFHYTAFPETLHYTKGNHLQRGLVHIIETHESSKNQVNYLGLLLAVLLLILRLFRLKVTSEILEIENLFSGDGVPRIAQLSTQCHTEHLQGILDSVFRNSMNLRARWEASSVRCDEFLATITDSRKTWERVAQKALTLYLELAKRIPGDFDSESDDTEDELFVSNIIFAMPHSQSNDTELDDDNQLIKNKLSEGTETTKGCYEGNSTMNLTRERSVILAASRRGDEFEF